VRHQENFGEAHLSAADGVIAHKSYSGVPARRPLQQGGFAAFLYVASTSPHEEGTTLAQKKSSRKKQAMTQLVLAEVSGQNPANQIGHSLWKADEIRGIALDYENCAIEGLKSAFGNRVLLPVYPQQKD